MQASLVVACVLLGVFNGLASDRKDMGRRRHGLFIVNPLGWHRKIIDEVPRHTTKSYAELAVLRHRRDQHALDLGDIR